MFQGRFRDEKITTDIARKLSVHELQALGISNTRDMMRIRNECVKYWTVKPKRVWSHCDLPIYDIPKTKLEILKKDAPLLTFLTFCRYLKALFTEEWHSLDYSHIWKWPWLKCGGNFKRVSSLWRKSVKTDDNIKRNKGS